MKYTISKGQQYDRDGAEVEHGNGRAYSQYRHDGQFDAGSPISMWAVEAVEAAVARVIATGTSEVLDIPRPGATVQAPVSRPSYVDCNRWTSEQGCPLHGELCNPAYR